MNTDKVTLTNLIQVGIVVKDLQNTLQKYINYNAGPWYILKFGPKNVDNMQLYGKKKTTLWI